MEDIYLIRRRNLDELRTTKANGNQSEMGRRLDIPPNLVSRYLGDKPIGPRMARRVEKVFGLERGWLDRVHKTDLEELVLDAFRNANEERRRAVLLVLEIPFLDPRLQQTTGRKVAS